MLLVLTAADFAAVGPGVWNDWKAEVLTDLYRRTMRHLAGASPTADSEERGHARREQVRAALPSNVDASWFGRQIDALPHGYLFGSAPQKIAAELIGLQTLGAGDVHAAGCYLPESRTVEFIIGTHEQITPGVFHKLCGALASQGLQILSAEINTLAEGMVLDRFYVHDPDYSDEPPASRLEMVNVALVESLRSPKAPAFRKVWRSPAQRTTNLNPLPTRVRTDNSTSDRYTILDIFAADRMGLLYTISRTVFELGLSVSLAKIGTYLDQVVDVFYVTDQNGAKIHDDERLQQISGRLIEAIDAMGQD
jgi:[protein-PII] uridylyltransferase